jgi:hypothetical protein
VSIWSGIRSSFTPDSIDHASPPRLSATSETALASALKGLPAGERGWITIGEARSLFSSMDDQYAFGEMDQEGKDKLASFAAQDDHCSDLQFMPGEGRLYFIRKPKRS